MTLIDFIYGLGIFQGASLLLVLLSLKGAKQYSNSIMAVMIFALMLTLAHNWLVRSGYFLTSPELSLSHLPLDYSIGPLLYFYGLSLTNHSFQKQQLLHFLPAMVAIVPMLLFNTIPMKEQTDILRFLWYKELSISEIDVSHLFWPWAWDLWIRNALQGSVYIMHVSLYCLLLIGVIRSNRSKLKNQYSSIEEKDLNWLRNLNYALICYLGVFLVFNRIPLLITTPDDPVNFYPNLTIVVIIQIIALVSIRHPQLIHGSQQAGARITPPAPSHVGSVSREEVISCPQATENPGYDLEKDKYKRSGLTLEDAQEYRIHVMKVMKDQRLYLESELTLQELADKAEIPPHQLSEVLNGQLNQNFYSFVNNYRVQYAKELLTDEKTSNMPIVELAFEAGFRSKSSFYDAFKKATSMTPTQYKQEHD